MLKLICNSHQTVYLGRSLDPEQLEETYEYKFYVGRISLRRGMAKAHAIISVLSREKDQITEQEIVPEASVTIMDLDTTIRLLAVNPAPNQAIQIECWNCGKTNLVETHLHNLETLWEFDAPEGVVIHQTRRGIAKKGKKWKTNQNFSL